MSIGWLISRAAVFTFTWFVFTHGVVGSWVVGVPAVIIALVVADRLYPSDVYRLSLIGLGFYAISFVKFSIIGGLDVTRRAYHPRMPLNPAIIEYPLKLSTPPARHLFVSTVSLLPGTLSVALGDDSLTIHVLDNQGPYDRDLKIIEARVAAIFFSESDLQDSVERIV